MSFPTTQLYKKIIADFSQNLKQFSKYCSHLFSQHCLLPLLTELYDFLNSTRKGKAAICDSDFSCLVLTVYKLTGNGFHSSATDVVHSLYPHHLIFHFEGFRYALFFGKLFYQPRKQCFRLLMGFRAIGVAKSLPCAVRIKLLTTLFADTFGYL